MKATNPLLIAMRDADIKMGCLRVYTSSLKDGEHRVKMYGRRSLPDDVAKKLGAKWKDVTVSQIKPVHQFGRFAIVVRARKA